MLVVHYGIWSLNGQGVPTAKKSKEQHSEINSYIGYGNIVLAIFNYYYYYYFKMAVH